MSMNKNDREYVAHMAATIFAGKEVTIKQAVHTACQILECVDARVNREAKAPSVEAPVAEEEWAWLTHRTVELYWLYRLDNDGYL